MIPGRTDVLFYAVCAIGIVASATDLARGKIYNWLTMPAALAGIAFSAYYSGWSGLGDSLLGLALGFVLYGWMFWIGMMGAGDIKLLMALGAWGGVNYCLRVGLLGVFLGGAMAFVILTFQGRIVTLGSKLYRFLLSSVVRELAFEPPAIDRKLTMPYGIPIAVAAIWILIEDPLKKWGIL